MNQVEHIFLNFDTQPKDKKSGEATVNEMVEEYNDKAEKTGMKNFMISTIANQDSDEDSENDEGFSIVIQREVQPLLDAAIITV